jgi:hypothetical protein
VDDTLSLPRELSKHPILDDGLDISVDLGEAVTRTSALAQQANPKPSSPMPLDYLSPMQDAKFAPVVRPRQPSECKKTQFLPYLRSHANRLRIFFLRRPCASAASDIALLTSAASGPSSRQAVIVKSRTGPLAPPTPHNPTAEESKEKKRKKAKKMKRDEIDEIFS